jgi:hypothetical protein
VRPTSEPENDDEPALIAYMTTRQPKRRDAAFLRTYAARVRDGSAVTWEIPSTVAGTLEAIAQRIEHRATNDENRNVALWAAIDVVKAQLGPFANWPDALKAAFSAAVIDADQTLTEAEMRHAQELAAQYGWERDNGTTVQPVDVRGGLADVGDG